MSADVIIRTEAVIETSLTGQLLLGNPLLKKRSAFPEDERRQFGLLALLPLHCSTMEEQLARTYENYKRKESNLERYKRRCWYWKSPMLRKNRYHGQ